MTYTPYLANFSFVMLNIFGLFTIVTLTAGLSDIILSWNLFNLHVKQYVHSMSWHKYNLEKKEKLAEYKQYIYNYEATTGYYLCKFQILKNIILKRTEQFRVK